jgi:hypothetical protein
MNIPSKDEIIRLFNKYAWGGVGNFPKFKVIKNKILGVPARNLMGCYKKIYNNCKENHKQLEQRLFKVYTYNLEWLERFWIKEAFIVIAEPLETDPIDAAVKIVLISRNVNPTAEDLAILNECGIEYYTDINFEIKRIVSCRIVVVGRTYYRKYQ